MSTVLVDEFMNDSLPGGNFFIMCHVIASDDATNRFRDWCINTYRPDNLRFKNKKKVHYTDEDTGTKQVLVEAVKNLDVTAKMYIWSDQGMINKAAAMRWSFGYQLQTDADSFFVVERSGREYDGLEAENVTISSFDDHPELAIADIFTGVYSSKFMSRTSSQSSTDSRFYTMLYPRIRFEIERKFDGSIEKRTRGKKTQR